MTPMQTLDSLKCLLVQTGLFWADAEANRQHLETIAHEHGADCDLIVFPETFTSGFMGDIDAEPEDMQGPTLTWMRKLSADLDSVICGSAAIATPAGRANRLLWVQPDGEVQFYDKRHLFPMLVRTNATWPAAKEKYFFIVAGVFARRSVTT
jgi:predicted amidohydrolase